MQSCGKVVAKQRQRELYCLPTKLAKTAVERSTWLEKILTLKYQTSKCQTSKYQTTNSEEGDKITCSRLCQMKVKSREMDWAFIQSKR